MSSADAGKALDVKPGLYVTQSGDVAVVEYVTAFPQKYPVYGRHLLPIRYSKRAIWSPVTWALDGTVNPGYASLDAKVALVERWDPEIPVPASYDVPEAYLREYGLTVDKNA